MFKIGDWIHQKNSNYENTYALVIGYTKKNKIECIAIQDFRPIAAKTTSTAWYPEPVLINQNHVPEKLIAKVEKKKAQLNH